MMHWAARYIGIPYRIGGRERDGLDCWGLVRLIYREEQNILLPDLPGVASRELLGISHEISRESLQSWTELQTPAEMCAVAMSQRHALHHVGIWTGSDGGKVIHCMEGTSVIAESLRNLRLRGMRTIKFFAYGLHN